jgi:glycogen synthase
MKDKKEILKTVRKAEQLWKKPKEIWNKVKKVSK